MATFSWGKLIVGEVAVGEGSGFGFSIMITGVLVVKGAGVIVAAGVAEGERLVGAGTIVSIGRIIVGEITDGWAQEPRRPVRRKAARRRVIMIVRASWLRFLP
jgi:hypothetical protein